VTDNTEARAGAGHRDTSDTHGRARPRKHANITIIEALRASGGIVSVAANKLNIARQTLHDWINDDPGIAACVAACREETLDLAEAQLIKAIRDGSEKSVHFILRTLGKARGYSERVILSGDEKEPLQIEHSHAFQFNRYTREELEALESLLAKGAADAVGGTEGAG